MYEDITKNKIKTGVIISIFIIVITLIVYYICMAFDLGTFSIIIALAFSILSAWGSYYYSDKIILSFNHARPATEAITLHLKTYFLSVLSLIFAILCATSPVIRPIQNFSTNVFGAPVIYTGSIRSAIPIPMAPDNPPYTPPIRSAASTQNAFPIWMDVASPPGTGILICRNVKDT